MSDGDKEIAAWVWCVFWRSDGVNCEIFQHEKDALAFKNRQNSAYPFCGAYVAPRPIRTAAFL